MKRILYSVFVLCICAGLSLSASAQVIADGDMEATDGQGANANWTASSTNFGTPFCSNALCGNCGGPCVAQSGTYYMWVGGISTANEVGEISQSITIPSNVSSASLTYWFYIPISRGDAADVFSVSMDGSNVWSTDATDTLLYGLAWEKVTVDVSAYADGNAHTLGFRGETQQDAGGAVTNFLLDNADITYPDPTGIFENALGSNVNIYPNPAQYQVNIDVNLEQAEDITLDLYDLTGALVTTKSYQDVLQKQINVNLDELSVGTYMIRLTSNDEVYTQQIMVTR